MKQVIAIVLSAIFTLSISAQVNIDRTKAPEPGPAPKISIGKAEKFVLENGLKVIVVENHKIPKVSFQLTIDMDPVLEGDKVGFTDMAGELISAQTGRLASSPFSGKAKWRSAGWAFRCRCRWHCCSQHWARGRPSPRTN